MSNNNNAGANSSSGASLESFLDSLARGVDGRKPPPHSTTPTPPTGSSNSSHQTSKYSPLPPTPPSSSSPYASGAQGVDSFFKRRSKTSATTSSDEESTSKRQQQHSLLSSLLPSVRSSASLKPKFSFLNKSHQQHAQRSASSLSAQTAASAMPIPTTAPASVPVTTTPTLSVRDEDVAHQTVVFLPSPIPPLDHARTTVTAAAIPGEDTPPLHVFDRPPLHVPQPSSSQARKTRARSRGSGDNEFLLSPPPTTTTAGAGTAESPTITLPEAIGKMRELDASLDANLLKTDAGALLVAKSAVRSTKPVATTAELARLKLALYNDKRLSKLSQKLDVLEEEMEEMHALAGAIRDEIKLECTKLCDSVNKLTAMLQSDSESLKQREAFFRTTTQRMERELKMIPEKVSDAVESKEKAFTTVIHEVESRIRALRFTSAGGGGGNGGVVVAGDSHGLFDALVHSLQEFFLLGVGTLVKLVAALIVFVHQTFCFKRKPPGVAHKRLSSPSAKAAMVTVAE